MKRTYWLIVFALSFGCSTPATNEVDGGRTDDGSIAPPDGAPDDAWAPSPIDGGRPSVTGIDAVLAGEYVTSYLSEGRLYSIAGTAARRGAGDDAPAAWFPPVEVALPESVRIVDGAGGLHFTIAADTDGHVWEWGDIDTNPDLVTHTSPIQLTNEDGSPFVLPGGVRSMSASIGTSAAVAGDGSVWVWDDGSSGRTGDGTDGGTVLHPVRVPLPDGVSIARIVIGDVMIALDDDGAIWTWGSAADALQNLGTGATDHRAPHRIETTSTGAEMPPVIDVTTGQQYSYALTASGDVYVWGVYLEMAGHCPGSGWCPEARPALSNDVLVDATASGAHVVDVEASSGASYAILSDGTLWAWGTNGQGLVGDGNGPDWAAAETPYAWDWSRGTLLVTRAVHIAPEVHDFVRVYAGAAYIFYAYAQTSDGRLYSWGRNKTGNLGNGVVPLNSAQAATYPNSWDVFVPTEVDPLHAVEVEVSSPHCEANPTADSCWCGDNREGPQDC